MLCKCRPDRMMAGIVWSWCGNFVFIRVLEFHPSSNRFVGDHTRAHVLLRQRDRMNQKDVSGWKG